jgi:hypothetical protein
MCKSMNTPGKKHATQEDSHTIEQVTTGDIFVAFCGLKPKTYGQRDGATTRCIGARLKFKISSKWRK